MTAKSTNERKAAERARKREAGLVKIEIWIKPEYKPGLIHYMNALKSLKS